MNRKPIHTISRDNPRITIVIHWGDVPPKGEILLYMRRVGEPAEFAVYPPLTENGGELTFQFDELLFVKKQGRYEGRLVIGAGEFGRIQVEYADTTYILGVHK